MVKKENEQVTVMCQYLKGQKYSGYKALVILIVAQPWFLQKPIERNPLRPSWWELFHLFDTYTMMI